MAVSGTAGEVQPEATATWTTIPETGKTKTRTKAQKAKKNPTKKTTKKKRSKLTARTADKHVLYQRSVQAHADDAKFYSRRFKKYTGRDLRVFREDFCGTAVLSCHHVLQHPDNIAIGVDLDQPTLDWGIEHNVDVLLNDEQKSRLHLLNKNVLEVSTPTVERRWRVAKMWPHKEVSGEPPAD